MMASSGVQEFYEVIQALNECPELSTGKQPLSLTFAIAGRCLWQSDIRFSSLNHP
jgi:hypothetical protein